VYVCLLPSWVRGACGNCYGRSLLTGASTSLSRDPGHNRRCKKHQMLLRQREVVFCAPVNLCDRRACSASVAVGIRSPSWHPAIVVYRRWATLSKNLTTSAYSGQHGTCLKGARDREGNHCLRFAVRYGGCAPRIGAILHCGAVSAPARQRPAHIHRAGSTIPLGANVWLSIFSSATLLWTVSISHCYWRLNLLQARLPFPSG
jgi:hypothetical protein